MSRIRILAVACVAVTALALASTAAPSTPKLNGTVGPGFTITLKKGGKKVKTLRHGTYKIVVNDRSSIHDFHLKGPGVNKKITSTSFAGTKSVTVKLKKGKYTYVCDPHASSMHGSFRVT
jgi:plastocyanin